MHLMIWSRVSSHRPCFWRKVCDCLHHAFLIFQQHFLDLLKKSLAAGGFVTSANVPMPLPVCAPHKDRGKGLCFRTFLITFRDGFRIYPWKQHLFIKFLSSYWRLRICSDRSLHVILHEGHSCPKLQNPPLMRMDSASPPNGGAQNDSMVGDVQGSFRNEGRVQSCSCGADSSELPLPVCAPHKDRGEGLCFRTFPTTFRARFLDLPMEAAFIHKISIQLLTPENLFWSLPECHSARRAFMPEVAESTTDTNGFCDSA